MSDAKGGIPWVKKLSTKVIDEMLVSCYNATWEEKVYAKCTRISVVLINDNERGGVYHRDSGYTVERKTVILDPLCTGN